MERPTLAETGPLPFPPHIFSRAEARLGRIYILDLAGFSALTERRIAGDARAGIETVSRLVAGFFSGLSARFAEAGIQYGGFAGDALIASSAPGAPLLSPEGFRALAADAGRRAGEPLAFRTGLADGMFHEVDGASAALVPSLVWGPAVSAAFAALKSAGIETTIPGERPAASDAGLVASATVTDRWSIIARLLDASQCAGARPEDIVKLVSLCGDICEAYGGSVENVAQDDKGLLIIIGLLRGGEGSEVQADRLLDELSRGLSGYGTGGVAVKMFGTLFQCRPDFSGRRRRVVFGAALNRAAKSLAMTMPRLPADIATTLERAGAVSAFVGRERELEALRALAETSRAAPVIACLTGPAGIGKSALLAKFRELHGAPGAAAELSPLDLHTPLGGARRVAQACGLGAGFVPSTEGLSLLRRSVPDQLFIENWHWCDPDSRRLLASLLGERRSGLLLITSRTADGLPATRGEPARCLEVGALPIEAARELARQAGARNAAAAEGLVQLAQGSPFWLIQAALQGAGSSGDAPGELTALLAARARHLSPGAVALWRLHCTWRTWLAPQLAADLLAELGLEAGREETAQLAALGWLQTDPASGSRPAHDILADWGMSDLPVSFERGLNQRVARRLQRLEVPASRIAAHWERAGAGRRAAVCFERGAREAAALGAHTACLENLGAVRRLGGGLIQAGSVRAARQEALSAFAYWGAGRLRKAEQYLIRFDRTAKSLKQRRRIRQDQVMASFVRSEVGQFTGNTQFILSGIAEGMRFSLNSPESHIAGARRASFFYYLLGLARLPVGRAFDRHIGKAVTRRDPRSEVALRLSAATLGMSLCRWPEADHQLDLARRAAVHTDDVQMTGTVFTLAALSALFQGKAGEALAEFRRLEQLGAAQGHQLYTVWAAYGIGESHFYGGDIPAARAATREAALLRRGLGDHQSSCIIEGMLAQTALAEGDYLGAERHARNALRFAARLPPSNFSTLEGIAAPAEIGARLTGLFGRTPARDQLMEDGLAALKRYAAPFTLARPRLVLAEGRRAEAMLRPRKAAAAYRGARTLARGLGMTFEHDLAERALEDLETKARA